jgi:hypothetical protein
MLALMKSSAKCDYGSEESMADTETFAVEVPKLDRSYANPQYGISGGNMIFRRSVPTCKSICHMQLTSIRDDLKGFFDVQV